MLTKRQLRGQKALPLLSFQDLSALDRTLHSYDLYRADESIYADPDGGGKPIKIGEVSTNHRLKVSLEQ